MEKIFRAKLKKQLRERIKGDISVHIIDDTLIIDINPLGMHPWHYTISNVAVQLSVGLTSKIVSDVIVKQYKKYILNKYFH
jgi:hypothetical protein